jgi:hypothetical protein
MKTNLKEHLPPVDRRVREHVGEAALVSAVEAAGGFTHKLTGLKGIPDRMTVVQGRVCFIEMKRPKGGRVAEAQTHIARRIAGAGGLVGVFSDVKDAIAFALGTTP